MSDHTDVKPETTDILAGARWHYMDAATVAGYGPWYRAVDYEALSACLAVERARTERAEATVAALTARLGAAEGLAGALGEYKKRSRRIPFDVVVGADSALAAWAAANPPTEGGA